MLLTSRKLRRLAPLAGLAFLGAAVTRFFVARPHRHHAAFSSRADDDIGDGTVRPAGPEAMRDPPRRWSPEDEASDESFPASDSSARY